MPNIEIVSAKMWGTERWAVYVNGQFRAGMFDSLKEAQAFAERITQ